MHAIGAPASWTMAVWHMATVDSLPQDQNLCLQFGT
jgi:hypothetical protein